jgi:Cu-processing system permease protein
VITAIHIAIDLLREAVSRKWFIAIFVGITLILGASALSLEMEVVDGALAATTLFGESLDTEGIRPAEVVLRPIFAAAAYVVFYGGLVFGVLACADFGPSLLAPGRIEHLLSLPVRRWSLLAGTFIGVMIVALVAALYGAGGFTLILAYKTGVTSSGLVRAALLATACFAAVYGAMLSAATFARSAALSAIVGLVVFVGGIFSGYRERIAPLFEAGLGRRAFQLVAPLFPPISAIADASALIARDALLDSGDLWRRVIGMGIFGVAALLLAVWRFERADY